MQEVVAINLANQHGSEGVLSTAFKDEAARYGNSDKGLRLVPFDFHKECGATRYDRWGPLNIALSCSSLCRWKAQLTT